MVYPNEAQAEYWGSAAGLKWIEHEHALDAAMSGMLQALLASAGLTGGERVLDVGCGTGASTLAASQDLGHGEVLGIDISEALLGRARDRARAAGSSNVSFLLADAQTHEFQAGEFDVLISRLGMSFFDDTLAAFRNLSRAIRDGGRMAFVSWAGADQNPWFSIPRDAAVARLGPAPKADPTAPGPLAFQEADRIAGLMEQAGLVHIHARPIGLTLTPPGGARGAARVACQVGPAVRIMKAHRATDADVSAIEGKVAEEFAGFARDGEVPIPAVVNLFSCRIGLGGERTRPRTEFG